MGPLGESSILFLGELGDSQVWSDSGNHVDGPCTHMYGVGGCHGDHRVPTPTALGHISVGHMSYQVTCHMTCSSHHLQCVHAFEGGECWEWRGHLSICPRECTYYHRPSGCHDGHLGPAIQV